MFTLLSTTEQCGNTNIPVLDIMTNEQVAHAIERKFKPQFGRVVESTNEMKSYVKTLRNDPETVFINPHCEVCEDAFILSFGFKK